MTTPPPITPGRDSLETRAEKALWKAVGEIQDDVTEARALAIKPEQVAEAVELGLMRAVSNPLFWTRATDAMQAHAAREAGGWLLGSVAVVLRKLALFALVGFGIYSLGGWTAVAKALAALRGA
jgi:hypothetical protein